MRINLQALRNTILLDREATAAHKLAAFELLTTAVDLELQLPDPILWQAEDFVTDRVACACSAAIWEYLLKLGYSRKEVAAWARQHVVTRIARGHFF